MSPTRCFSISNADSSPTNIERQQDNKTTRQQDNKTTRQQDTKTTRQQDNKTTRQQDNKTTRQTHMAREREIQDSEHVVCEKHPNPIRSSYA
jgi:hypothetical protein